MVYLHLAVGGLLRNNPVVPAVGGCFLLHGIHLLWVVFLNCQARVSLRVRILWWDYKRLLSFPHHRWELVVVVVFPATGPNYHGEKMDLDSTGSVGQFWEWLSTLFIFWNANPIIIFCWYGNCYRCYYYCCVSESYSLYIHITMCCKSLWSVQFQHILVLGNCTPNHYFSLWCHKAILTQSFNVLGALPSKKKKKLHFLQWTLSLFIFKWALNYNE